MRETTGRGWGPFTGAQLTVLLVTMIVVVAFPFAASAVTSSNVTIADGVSGAQATVSKAGALTVAPASPLAFVRGHLDNPPVSFAPLIKPGSGKALVITTVHIDTHILVGLNGGIYVAFAISTNDATCATAGNTFHYVHPTSVGTIDTPITPGVVVPAGRALCVRQGTVTDFRTLIDAYGYSIPAAAAPAGA